MAKTIEVIVNTGGGIKIDAVGFKGAAELCPMVSP